MKKLWPLGSIIISTIPTLFPVSCQNEWQTINVSDSYHVIDGDTIRIYDSRKTTIRLFGIDTPETKKDSSQKLAKLENYYAQKAKIYLLNLLKNKKFYYQIITKDKYGRYVAKLFYEDQNQKYDVALSLLNEGLAVVKYINVDGKNKFTVKNQDLKDYFYKLKNAENDAKKNKRNIWKENLSDVYSKL